MLIRKKRVLKLEGYLGGLIPHTEIRLVAEIAHVPAPALARSGFAGCVQGDVLLPPAVGPASRANSEGTFAIHRDQPKERRFVGRREWTRREWAGPGETREVTESTDIYRDCYPRTFLPPAGIELTVVAHHGALFVVSPPLTWQQTSDADILHVLNMMLELFGEVEVRHENLVTFTPPHTQRVNWTMLPPGVSTASGVVAHVSAVIAGRARTFRAPIMARLSFLASRNPPEVYLGHGGFHAYVAYVFPTSGMTVLESVMPNNATYVFAGNWKAVAHLTKTQILDGGHYEARIIHDQGWEANLSRYAPTEP